MEINIRKKQSAAFVIFCKKLLEKLFDDVSKLQQKLCRAVSNFMYLMHKYAKKFVD